MTATSTGEKKLVHEFLVPINGVKMGVCREQWRWAYGISKREMQKASDVTKSTDKEHMHSAHLSTKAFTNTTYHKDLTYSFTDKAFAANLKDYGWHIEYYNLHCCNLLRHRMCVIYPADVEMVQQAVLRDNDRTLSAAH